MLYYQPKRITHRDFSFDALFSGVVFIISLTIFLAIFIIHAPFFRIGKIIIQGNDPLIASLIGTHLQKNFPYLFSSRTRLIRTLILLHPQIQNLTLHLDLFSRTLKASYTLRTAHFLWCQKETPCFAVDENGILFASSDLTSATFLTHVEDYYFQDLTIGKKFPFSYINPLLAIEKMLSKKELPLSSFRIEAPFSLKVKLSGGVELRFTNLQIPVDQQLRHFEYFFNSLPLEEFSQLEYVDLRVKNRIYYR